jgi:hypothetical protein
MAEGVGFEPTSPFREAVFKTAALSHSAIPPVFPPKNNVTVFVLRVRYESLLLFYAVNPI